MSSAADGLERRWSFLLPGVRTTGVLAQVDVDHTGHTFQPYDVDIAALAEEQASCSEESAWREAPGRAVCLAEREP